jgi:3-hydroxy-9,10-secoandrosta-1,3,5(10)-triene-9,17-dione monooxygenase
MSADSVSSSGAAPGLDNPSRKDLVARAQALIPALNSRWSKTNEARCISQETIDDFQTAGFFKIFQPKRYGGFELNPNALFESQIEIARACPSSAWVLGVVAVHNWQLALFSEETQDEVWAENPKTLISSSYMPVGKVQRVEGGFRLSGRWGFSSGSAHCDWSFLGAFVPPAPEAKGPDMRTFLLPRSDYRIEDTWHVSGLRGTGSNDIVVEDVFVPERRTHRMSDGFRCRSPGNEVNTAALYKIPFGQIFVRSVSTAALGMAQGALDVYRDSTKTRVGRADGAKAVREPAAQKICAEAEIVIDREKHTLFSNFDRLMSFAEGGERIPVELRARFRYESSMVVVRCLALIDEMFTASGGRAIFSNDPLQRYFQDIHACRAHYANNPEKPGLNFGSIQLDLGNSDFFI